MPRELVLACVLLAAAILFASQPALAQEFADSAGGIVFQAAEDTRLGEILTNRRLMLEKRQGGPLTGHQWWLWGLGSFDYDLDGDVDLLVCVHGSTSGAIIRNEL